MADEPLGILGQRVSKWCLYLLGESRNERRTDPYRAHHGRARRLLIACQRVCASEIEIDFRALADTERATVKR